MKLEEITNEELKNHINMAYLHGENNNQEKINEINEKIGENISRNMLITVTENDEFLKIPYGNNDEFVIPIFTDNQQLNLGMDYFKLNDMEKNKIPKIIETKEFRKIKENPNFLGLLINIASVSYIITPEMI